MSAGSDYQHCEHCGDFVYTLSSRGYCDGCEEWSAWWSSLTPEQRAAEQASMDRYGSGGE